MVNPSPAPTEGKRRPGFSIADALYLFVCCSVAMTIAVPQPPEEVLFPGWKVYQPHLDWHYALLSLTSLGAIGVLLHQGRHLREMVGFRCVQLARFGVAGLLFLCLAMRLLTQRGVLELPGGSEVMLLTSGQVLLDSLWYLLVVASISIATGYRCKGGHRLPRWAIAGLYALVCIFVLYAAALSGYNTYLVHNAIRGIETAMDPRFQVTPAGASLAEQHAIATQSLMACLAWLAGVGISIWGLFCPPASPRARAALAGVVGCCMAGAAGFAVWYFQIGLIELSVCWAEARFASDWFDRLIAALVATAALSWIAGSLSKTTSRSGSPQSLSLVDLSGKLLIGGAVATTAVGLGQMAMAMLDVVNLLIGVGMQWWERVGFLVFFLGDAQVLLLLAMLLATARLLRARLRREPRYAAECDGRRALLLTLLFLVFAAVGAPTLAAFSLCAWLGPWYS